VDLLRNVGNDFLIPKQIPEVIEFYGFLLILSDWY